MIEINKPMSQDEEERSEAKSKIPREMYLMPASIIGISKENNTDLADLYWKKIVFLVS